MKNAPRRLALTAALLATVVLGASAASAGSPHATRAEPGLSIPVPPDLRDVSASPGPVAIVDVDVIPMDGSGPTAGQTVVVRDGRIAALGATAEVDVPDGATVVDGTGRFLIPGLSEMHGHLPGGDWPEGMTEDVLFLYVANGVTTVRGMQGDPSQLALRDRIAAGELLGPRLFVGSPAMTGGRIGDPDRARRLVNDYVEAGYDHLKVHEGLSPDVYRAIVAEADSHGIRFAGHVPNAVGLFDALEAGQATVDHLDNYVEALLDDPSLAREAGLFDVPELVDRIDESRIPEVVRATLEAGAAIVPTMALWETFLAGVPGTELRRRRPEVRYMPDRVVDRWEETVNRRAKSPPSSESRQRVIELRRRLLDALHEAGVPVLLGTDSPQLFSVPGFSVHREVEVMAESGLTPREILESGTAAVARYYGSLDDFGTVEVGKRADLVLLESNPLDDLDHLSRRAGVLVAGHWLPEEEIQRRLVEIAGE